MVLICRHCDRGQRYCEGGCAPFARCESLRQAGRRYQQTSAGKLNHAARQQHYLLRQEQRAKMTHQGSESPESSALLPPEPDNVIELPHAPDHLPDVIAQKDSVFHFCGVTASPFWRTGFVRYPAQIDSITQEKVDDS